MRITFNNSGEDLAFTNVYSICDTDGEYVELYNKSGLIEVIVDGAIVARSNKIYLPRDIFNRHAITVKKDGD